MAHLAIIGAGITGITSAYALLRRGHAITVIDRHEYPAMETSYANGGQLSASNAEVWNSVATVSKGLKWLARHDAPLLINPSPSYHKYSWLAEFCGQIRNYERNTINTTRLALAARKLLFKIAEDENIDFDFKRAGILHIYSSRQAFESAAKSNELLRKGGLERIAVTAEEIRGIEPALKGNIFAGFFTPSDATGDIHKFTRALAASCEKLGANMVLGCDVKSVLTNARGVSIDITGAGEAEVSTLQADAVLICAGVASRRFAALLGDRLNIYPVKGYSITVMLGGAEASAPEVSLLDEDAKIVTSRLGADRFRVAGTAEFNGFNRDIRADRIAPLVHWCRRHFPTMPTDKVIPWSGLRPMTPSMMPRVGRGRSDKVFYNTGHGHLGWTLSAATAEAVADAIDLQMAVEPRVRAAVRVPPLNNLQ